MAAETPNPNPNAKGLLFVYGEPGPNVPDDEFNDWYTNSHAPLRLTVPGISTALRFRATDAQSPAYLAMYDLASPGVMNSKEYKNLGASASEYEKNLVKKLGSLERRVYEALGAEVMAPGVDVVEGKGEYQLVVTMRVPRALEEEFNAWYDTEHVPDIVKTPGCLRARRFRLVESVELTRQVKEEGGDPQYLAVYDFTQDGYMGEAQFVHGCTTPWSKRVLGRVQWQARRFRLQVVIQKPV